MDDHQFAWILWYIWKGRNNKVFSNLDTDPRDTLKLAETESTLWAEAQVLKSDRIVPPVEVTTIPSIPGRWCFTDGSWKENDSYSGQGWLSTLEGFDGLLGARNVRACLSPSTCGDRSFNLGNGMYVKLTSISGHVCNGLLSIGEDGFKPRRVASICKLFRRHQDPEGRFSQFRDHLCTKDAKFEGE